MRWLPVHSKQTGLVTGGLGFIGSNLVDTLLADGRFKVIVFDDESNGHHRNPAFSSNVTETTKKDDFLLIKDEIDYVVHLAAAISVAESVVDPEKYYRINVQGSNNVLSWALDHSVKKVVSASSAALYGDPKHLPVKEDDEIMFLSPYAESKAKMEQLHKDFYLQHNLQSVCLRFFNVYGPRQNPKSPYSGVISKFIEKASNGEELLLLGNGTNSRDFIYVKDVNRAILLTMLKDTGGFSIFNVGSQTSTSIIQLAYIIKEVTGSSSEIQKGPPRPGDILHSLSDSSKLYALGFHPKVTLEDGLAKTYAEYSETKKMENFLKEKREQEEIEQQT